MTTTTTNTELAAEPRSAGSTVGYIVGPAYDWLLFLGPPAFSLLLGIALAGTTLSTDDVQFWGEETTVTGLLIGALIHAHLVIVFWRSHADARIREQYRFRFFGVPVLLYLCMMASPWVLVFVSVLATFWDVYHSALQTFGFGRMYDRKAGNDATVGRRLDWWLNQLLYAGPILAGASMMDHFEDFEEFENVGSAFFTSIPAFMEGNQRVFAWAVIGLGTLFIAYYVLAYWRLSRRGYRVSPLKVWLLASTGLVSIYTWGFNSWGMAFFIMNLFHALQYFGIVWSFENKNIMKVFRLDGFAFGKPLTLVLFVGTALLYGTWVEVMDTDVQWLWSITLIVSIMHFWYDGFIWSVRKKQV